MSGSNLTAGPITVTAPTNYEVSLNGTAFSSSVSIAYTAPTLAPTTISVRLQGGLNVATYNEIITNAGGGAPGASVTVSGSVTAVPTLTVTPNSLSGFSTAQGTASAAMTYTLTGTDLTSGVTVTPPAGYQMAQSATNTTTPGTYGADGAAITVTQAAATAGHTIYVRLSAAATGTPSGNVTNAATGAINQNVAVSGTVTPAVPTITSFTPTAGPVSTVVTITGTGFVAGTTVAFNGTAATAVTVVSATSIQASVPTGATTGTISVSNANGTATSTGTFTVTIPNVALATGQLLLEDDFNYATGTRLVNNGWVRHSPTGNNGLNDDPDVVATNLTQSMYPTGSLASNANHVLSSSTSDDVNKGFTASSGTNVLYYSVLINIPMGETRPDYFLHLLERSTTGLSATNFRAKLFVRTSATANSFNLGVSIISNLSQTSALGYTTTEYAEGQTYLVVVKYEYVTGGSDRVSLFAFDNATAIPTAEPTPLVTLQEANNGAYLLPNGIAIRQTTTSPIVDLDGIRVATGWGAVTGNPVYTEVAAVINAGNYYAVTMNNAAARLTPNGAANVENNLTLTNGLINTSATNSLTLYAGATVSGGGPTSYVNGPVLRQTAPGAASSVFPIGKGGAYRPITLTATGQVAASTYTAEQLNMGGGPSVNAPLQRVSSKHYFTVTSSNTTAGNFTGTITLSFGTEAGQEDYVNAPDNQDLVIAKRDNGGPWNSIGRSSFTGVGAGAGGPSVAGTLTSAPFSNFSDFALGAQNVNPANPLAAINPLPVELTAFTAQRQPDGRGVALKWATATERNSARFEVQRSDNGRDFSTVATVAAAGSSSQPTTYAALDQAAPATTLYYRLRQVDRDGTAAFSPVATVAGGSVAGNGVAGKVLLFPNPAARAISFLAAEATPYRVLSQLGQVLLSGTAEAGTVSIGIESLPAGLYFLELQTATGRTVQKFEKQ